jgi:hypothetical protein
VVREALTKIRDIELEPGKSVRGWMLGQLPTEFDPPNNALSVQVRLKIRDTAGDDEVEAEPLRTANRNDNILTSSFRFEPVHGVDLRTYEIITYTP